MKKFSLSFLLISSLCFSQKKKYKLDVTSNIDAKVILMKPIGNNSLAKDLQPFYGFGFGGNLITPINFGIGVDYNMLFSNVIYGKENLYGSIGSPVLTAIDFFLTYRYIFSEDFSLEGMAGFSYYFHKSLFNYETNKKYLSTGNGFNLGSKIIYTLDREGIQQIFLSAKANSYNNNVYNENSDIQNYYNHSTFLSLGLGYRYNF